MNQLLPVSTSRDESDRGAEIAVLPVGSFEQHGDYLPLSTDTLIACAIAQRIASAYDLMLLPPITIACSHEHAGWRGTVSISARTLHSVITDIAESLRSGGVEQMLLVNGHGGNYVLSNIVQEASVTGARMALFPSGSDWRVAREAGGLETDHHSDMHAGELETSILLHTASEVVRLGNETADHQAADRPHLLTLGMRAYTTNGVIGSPSLGTAAKGEAVLASLTESANTYVSALTGPSK